MVFIVLGGQERGNNESMHSLNRFIESLKADVYVGSPNEWNSFEIKHEWIKTNPLIYNSIFDVSEHDHHMRYKYQWSALYQTYEFIQNRVEANDIIIKLRNDVVISMNGFELPDMNDNQIWVPEKEFHEDKPFDASRVCNDQIVMGKKKAMHIYFNLPYGYDWMTTSKGAGIEEILRMYLLQNDLELKTFKLDYKRATMNP